MSRLLLVAILIGLLPACAHSPLKPREGESRVTVRVVGANGKVPEVAHVFVGSHGERIDRGAFTAGVRPGGVRVLRIMSPLHHAVTLPLMDTGSDQHIEVKLGTPPLLENPRSLQVLFKDGGVMPMRQTSDGRFVAWAPTGKVNAGIRIGGVSVGAPLSVEGARSYVPTQDGEYWSEFSYPNPDSTVLIAFSTAALRYDAAQPVVTFSERSAGALYEVAKWGERQRTELITTLHGDWTDAALGRLESEKLGEQHDQRAEEAARFLAEMVDGTRAATNASSGCSPRCLCW